MQRAASVWYRGAMSQGFREVLAIGTVLPTGHP